MKKIFGRGFQGISGIAGITVFLGILGLTLFLATPVMAATPNWDFSGAWDLSFVATTGAIGTYNHHMDVTQASNGDLTGTGFYIPAPSFTWVIDPGSNVSEDSVHILLHYTSGHPNTWTTTFDATVDSIGHLSGTWSDNQGNSGPVTSYDGTAKAMPVAACPADTIKSSSIFETVTVDSASSISTPSTKALLSGKNYLLVSSGTWQNNNLNVADTEYASTNNWATHMNGYDIAPYFLGAGEFDLQVNGNFVNWGAYNPNNDHKYSFLYSGTGAPVNLGVFDGDSNTKIANSSWYGDNSGKLTVNIYSCDPTLPTSKDQCKNGGWKNFGGIFKNQGDCVSFVATGGKNPPANP